MAIWKRWGTALLQSGFWSPAVALMRDLRFPAKSALIASAFLAPLLLLLGLWSANQLQLLQATAAERDGLRVARALYPALEQAGEWRYQARSAAFGNKAAHAQQAAQAYDTAHAELQRVLAPLAAGLGAKAAWRNLEEARQAAREAADAAQPAPDLLFDKLNGLSRALLAVLDRSTDGSGLTLESEATPYHLMSVLLLHAPQVIQNTGELRGLGGSALQMGSLTTSAALQIERRLTVIEHELVLARAALTKVKSSADPVLTRLSLEAGPQSITDTLALARKTFAADQVGQPLAGGRQAWVDAVSATQATQFKQVKHNLAVLDDLLAERQRALAWQLGWVLAASALGVAVAVYLLAGFYGAMTSGFKALRQQVINIGKGDLQTTIQTFGRDEVGTLLRELALVQASLHETVTAVRGGNDKVVRGGIEAAQGSTGLSARTEVVDARIAHSTAAH
jgi:hypothetical protein